MAPSHVIRIPRTDTGEDGEYVLGEVKPSDSNPLNLKIAATEGEEPYVVKRKSPPLTEPLIPSQGPSLAGPTYSLWNC